jgi:hypothetical protein
MISALGCADDDPEPGSPEEHEEIFANLVEAGFPEDSISVVDGEVVVGNDAHVTLEASREMIQVDASSDQEHYRTYNLVGLSKRVICIDGRAFSGKLSTGLNAAIANYNALGLSFRMRRTTGSNSGCNAEITAKLTSGSGGKAGFPSGGRPYGQIKIGRGLSNYPAGTIEHVITHELGHCVGLRHTDFYNRSISCGTGGRESTVWDGAVHIPGTPTTASVGGSVMNACFRRSESGNFKAGDKTALRYLY